MPTSQIIKQFSGPSQHMFFDIHTNRKFLGTNPTLDYEFSRAQGEPLSMADTPSSRLLIAVMERAFQDLKKPKLRRHALTWIQDPRNWGICSFVFIAREILGCDPKKLREAMIK